MPDEKNPRIHDKNLDELANAGGNTPVDAGTGISNDDIIGKRKGAAVHLMTGEEGSGPMIPEGSDVDSDTDYIPPHRDDKKAA